MTSESSPAPRRRPLALLADLDGTLLDSPLDLAALKREVGAHDTSILEHLATLPLDEAARGWAIVASYENRAAEHAVWAPGAARLLAHCRASGVAVAIVTNNSGEIVRPILARLGIECAVVIAREDAIPKPAPEPILLALQRLGVSLADAAFLGDAELDVRAGAAAGIHTVHVGPHCQGHCQAHAATLDEAWPLLGL